MIDGVVYIQSLALYVDELFIFQFSWPIFQFVSVLDIILVGGFLCAYIFFSFSVFSRV